MTASDLVLWCEEVQQCLQACVEDYVHAGEPPLAEACEDAYRASLRLRAWIDEVVKPYV